MARFHAASRPMASPPSAHAGREHQRLVVGAHRVLVRSVQECEVPLEVACPRASLARHRGIAPDDLDDAPRALDLRVPLLARVSGDPGVDLFFAEAPPELLADPEERQPQVERPVRPLLEQVGRPDAAVLADPRRQVVLEVSRRGRGVPGVESHDGRPHRRRLPIERPRRIPSARGEEKESRQAAKPPRGEGGVHRVASVRRRRRGASPSRASMRRRTTAMPRGQLYSSA